MILALALALALLAMPQETPATGGAPPELAVRSTLEELRKGELFLDAFALEPQLAASLTIIEGGGRYSGSFAFLEPMRRARERGATVKELAFNEIVIRVYGASAVATYRYRKTSVDGGARHGEEGWSSDVFELRDDGAWILVLRHRARR
jgi:hypothetical protein